MKKNILLGLLIISSLFLAACKGGSISNFEYIIDDSYTEFITMGTSADYPPYEWPKTVDGKVTLVGIDIEIAKEIAKKVGKNLRVINKNFDFLIEDLKNNKVDFVMAGMTITEDRAKVVNFSDYYYEAENVLVVNKKNQDIYNTIDSLNQKNKKVATQSGTVQIDAIEELFPNSIKQYLPSMVAIVNDLSNERIDGIVMDKPVALAFLKSFDNLVLSDVKFEATDDKFAIAVNKKNDDLLKTVNEVIKDLKETGKLDEIFKNIIG